MSDKELIIRIGAGANRILNDEVAVEAMESLVNDLKADWLRSRPDDVAGREATYRLVQAVQLLVAKLQAMRDAGLKAQQDVNHRAAEAKGQTAFH